MAGIADLWSNVPTDIRLYLEFMAGKDTPITEKDFTKDELEYIRQQLKEQQRVEKIWHESGILEKAPDFSKTHIDYPSYPEKDMNSTIHNSLGGYTVYTDSSGNRVAKDVYDFNKYENPRWGLDEDMDIFSGLGTFAKAIATGQLGRRDVAEMLARILRPEGNRNVEINLGADNGN